MAGAVSIRNVLLPSFRKSATPVTVTICGVLQLSAVNVRLAGVTTPSAVFVDATPMITSAVGWRLRNTVKVSLLPSSETDRPLVRVTVMPGCSLSMFTTWTSDASNPL
jgi:hypothetical protein